MSPELIGLLTAIIAVGALNVTLVNQSGKRTALQIEQLKTEMDRRFDQMFEEMNRRFDAQDERIQGLEQGQSHLSGQFSALKDYFTHQPTEE